MRHRSIQPLDLGLLFVVLVWGLSPTLFKVVLQEMDPLAFVFLRFLILSAFSAVVLAIRGMRGGRAWHIERTDILLLIVSGLSGYGIYQLFYMVGLAHTSVFASALLLSTVPLWSVVIIAVLRIERVHAAQWGGILLSLIGVAGFLLAAQSHTSELAQDQHLTTADLILGNVLSLGAAALFALYGVTNKRLAARYSPPELMCYTLLVGTLALAPFGVPALEHQHWAAVTWRTWLILPYSVIFPIYVTYSIWNWAIGKRGVGYVTLYTYAVPVMGGIFAWLLLGEVLTPPQIVAGMVVIGGMLAARWGASRTAEYAAMSTPAAAGATVPVAEESLAVSGTSPRPTALGTTPADSMESEPPEPPSHR